MTGIIRLHNLKADQAELINNKYKTIFSCPLFSCVVPTNGNYCLSFWSAAVLSGKHYLTHGAPVNDAFIVAEVLNAAGAVIAGQSYNYFTMCCVKS